MASHRPAQEPAPLWRDRAYLLYRSARVVSILGSSLSWIAYPLLVLATGGTAVQAGAVATCAFVAEAACRLPAGRVADRYDRRRLMIGMDLVRMAAVASIPLAASAGVLSYWQLLAVALVAGAADSVFSPAATALLRDLVPAPGLPAAITHTQASRGVVSLLGPILGGLCFGLDRMLPFAADAASYGVSACLLLAVAIPPARRKERAARPGAEPVPDGRLTAGLRWLWRRPAVLRVTICAGAVNLLSAACQVAVVVTLRRDHTAAAVIGVVMAGCGVGAVAGSLLARRVAGRLGAERLFLVMAGAWAAGFAAFAAAPSPWLIGPVLAALYLLSPASGLVLAQITVGEAPRELLGRVTTAEQMISGSLGPAGPVLAGVLLQAIGGTGMWLTFSATLVVAAAVTVGPLLSSPGRPAARVAGAGVERP